MQGAKQLAKVFSKDGADAATKQKWMLVEDTDAPADEKVPAATKKSDVKNDPKEVSARDFQAWMASTGLKIGVKGYKTDVAIRSEVATSSGAFYGGVVTLQPNSASVTEAAQFAALFDQARCLGVTVKARVAGNSNNAAGAWMLVFDPSNAGAYTSVIGGAVARQHIGPVGFNAIAASSGTTSATASFTASGYQSKRFETLKTAPSTGSSSGEVVGNNWFATSDVNVIVGYLKWAIDAQSGASFITDVFIIYHMEYRSRT